MNYFEYTKKKLFIKDIDAITHKRLRLNPQRNHDKIEANSEKFVARGYHWYIYKNYIET